MTRDVFADSPYARPTADRPTSGCSPRPTRAPRTSAGGTGPPATRCRKAAYDAVGGFDVDDGLSRGLRARPPARAVGRRDRHRPRARGRAPRPRPRHGHPRRAGVHVRSIDARLRARHPGTSRRTTPQRGPWSRAVAPPRPSRIDSRARRGRARPTASTPCCPGFPGGSAARRSPGPSRRLRPPADEWATPSG